jgi:hypothetical protein
MAEKSEDFCLDFVQEFGLCSQFIFEFAVSNERLLTVAVWLHSSVADFADIVNNKYLYEFANLV